MSHAFVPEAGDFVWLTFDPQAGREQSGRRPALVVSPSDYNRVVGLALVCPVTTQVKGYPFEIPLPAGTKIKGVILADHIKSIDWQARNAVHICDAPKGLTLKVLGMLEALMDADLT